MVLSWSWNILRRVETSKLLFAADFTRWMNKVTGVFGRKQSPLSRCLSVADPDACMHQGHLHSHWLEWEWCISMVTQVEMLLGRSWAEVDTRTAYCFACLSISTVADLSVMLYWLLFFVRLFFFLLGRPGVGWSCARYWLSWTPFLGRGILKEAVLCIMPYSYSSVSTDCFWACRALVWNGTWP